MVKMVQIAMASKVIIPEADAVKFPDLAVDSPAGGALHLPLVAPALQDDGGEAGDHVIPSASLVCLSFRASSLV
jgi:ATPase complex subunit ATP10